MYSNRFYYLHSLGVEDKKFYAILLQNYILKFMR